MSAIDDVANAAGRKLRAQAALDAANDELTDALINLHREWKGTTPKYRIGWIVRDFLSRHGFTPYMIRRLAISDGSVRNMLDKGKPPHES